MSTSVGLSVFYFVILILISFLILHFFATEGVSDREQDARKFFIIFTTVCALTYVGTVFWYIITRKQILSIGGIFVGLLAPVQNLLYRIVLVPKLNQWLGFAIVMLLVSLGSVPGFALLFWSIEPEVEWNDLWGFWMCAALFVGLAAVYYYLVVLRSSATSVLMSLHPRGRELAAEGG